VHTTLRAAKMSGLERAAATASGEQAALAPRPALVRARASERRHRSATLHAPPVCTSPRDFGTPTRQTLALAKAHLASIKNRAVEFERELCVACTLVARNKGILATPSASARRVGADGALLVLAPSDIEEAEMAKHRQEERVVAARESRARAARQRRRVQSVNFESGSNAAEPAEYCGGGADDASDPPPRRLDKQHSFSFDVGRAPKSGSDIGARRTALRAPEARQTQELLQQRARNTRVMAALNSARCDFSSTELYNAVWCGLGDTTREQFWIMQALPRDTSALVSRAPRFYELLESAWLPETTYDQIRKDLFRTFPHLSHSLPYFINDLYRGLVAHAVLRPDIGYVQGMNALWGLLVIAVSQPQQRLLVAEHIVLNILPHYFTTYSLGQQIDAIVLRYYFERRRKSDYTRYCERFGEENTLMLLTNICVKDFGTMYAFTLPNTEALRMWDMVLMRGAPALFEFAVRYLHFLWKKRYIEHCENWIAAAQLFGKLFEQVASDPERSRALYESIARTELPLGRIDDADLDLRRRVATRTVFERTRADNRAVASPR